MKNKILTLSLMMFAMATIFAACSNDDGVVPATELREDSMSERIAALLDEITTNQDDKYDGGGYIIYEAASDSMFVLNEQLYDMVNALASKLFDAGTTGTLSLTCDAVCNAPQGEGWIYVGTCKGRTGSLKLAYKVAKDIPVSCDFEIHAEFQEDGTYKVWYRIIK